MNANIKRYPDRLRGSRRFQRILSGTAGREETIWSNLMFLRAIGVLEAALSGFDKLPLPGMPETRLRDFLTAAKP
ncbi:hypothetical protein [Rhizobium laguerreae]|uniref:Uncharacterized protein n=1 Tax=Rhizobium laguerreae TaxID=1076926 RepID=A0A6N9ZLD7_9HYPH|nr:hypothetical protein [Rhizobium laguerreae]NEH94242.1 hypothetical protein [Rhizobium laguerreae]